MPKKNSNPTRRILIGIGVLVLVVAAGVFGARTMGLVGGPEETIVDVSEAERRDITQTVTASGKIQPEVDVMISPDVSGEITFLGVQEGDQVQQGDRLVGIDQEVYVQQVEQMEASLNQAKASERQAQAQLLNAEAEFQRQKKLYEREVIPQQEFETARTNYQVAQAQHESAEFQVQNAQARLQEAREQLQKTDIYAPMDGTVTQLNVEAGERVVGTEQQAGTELMQIARLDRMEAEVDVNENDVVNVELGDTASVEVDALPGWVFEGQITEIANSGRTSNEGTQQQITNFPVKIRITGARRSTGGSGAASAVQTAPLGQEEAPVEEFSATRRLRPGMSATADMFTETVFGGLAVPIQAVTVRDLNRVRTDSASEGGGGENQSASGSSSEAPEQNQSFGAEQEDLRTVVFVYDEGTTRMEPVTTGISDDTHMHVIEGIEPGEQVVIGPYGAVSRELSAGDRVRRRSEAGGGQAVAAQF